MKQRTTLPDMKYLYMCLNNNNNNNYNIIIIMRTKNLQDVSRYNNIVPVSKNRICMCPI